MIDALRTLKKTYDHDTRHDCEFVWRKSRKLCKLWGKLRILGSAFVWLSCWGRFANTLMACFKVYVGAKEFLIFSFLCHHHSKCLIRWEFQNIKCIILMQWLLIVAWQLFFALHWRWVGICGRKVSDLQRKNKLNVDSQLALRYLAH